MKIRDVDIGVLTHQDITSNEKRDAFFELIQRECPHFMPEKYDTAEPVRRLFTSPSALAASDWKTYFFWKRPTPAIDGSLFFAEEDEHHGLYVRASRVEIDLDRVVAFVESLANAWRPDFAYIYLLEQSVATPSPERTVMPFRRGVVSRDLQQCIPDFPWTSILGPAYVQRLGAERIRTTPVVRIEEVASDVFVLQAVKEHFAPENLRAAADAAIRHVGPDHFCHQPVDRENHTAQ